MIIAGTDSICRPHKGEEPGHLGLVHASLPLGEEHRPHCDRQAAGAAGTRHVQAADTLWQGKVLKLHV